MIEDEEEEEYEEEGEEERKKERKKKRKKERKKADITIKSAGDFGKCAGACNHGES